MTGRDFSYAYFVFPLRYRTPDKQCGPGRYRGLTAFASLSMAVSEGLAEFPPERDLLGDAYEYLIGQFAAGSGKKAGEFYTPQQISAILSGIVSLDSQDPASGKKKALRQVLDFACGSGSLLLNVRQRLGKNGIGRLFGEEKQACRYLVIDFGTSKSPKSTRQRDNHYCPGRPASVPLRHTFVNSALATPHSLK
ncbi:N-6 DNA methylase [Thiolapillus sp.]|uniref:N-6 DNA methylase n=1 Tax=Thiolapillus sp. TaxID=2017437 RepID=UPI003AF581DB